MCNDWSGERPGSLPAAEIAEQPRTLAQQLESKGDSIREVARRLARDDRRYLQKKPIASTMWTWGQPLACRCTTSLPWNVVRALL